MKKKELRNQFLVSIIGTTAGVFIAFLLNNWNTQRLQQNESQRVYEKLVEEVRVNLSTLEHSIDVSRGTQPSLSKLVLEYEVNGKIIMSSEQMRQFQKDFPNRFIKLDSIFTEDPTQFEFKGRYDFNEAMFVHLVLKESSWKSALSVGALNHMTFESIQKFEEIYSTQEQVVTQSKKLMSTLDVSMKEYVRVLDNLVQYEQILLEKYNALLSSI